MNRDVLLDIRNLDVDYLQDNGVARAVDNFSLQIRRGEIVGLAGESGCGKSTVAFALPRLHRPPALITGGEIWFNGENVLAMDDNRLGSLRWGEISMVFQSAMNALNPVTSIASQFADVLLHHKAVKDKKEAEARARELLALVEIAPERVKDYPHQFSGGMRQRLAIAMALALKPDLVIMDEPTTALDVVVQRQILLKVKQLQEELGFAILFITHDLSLMVELCDRIGIMYAGKLVETAPANDVLRHPRHPYTNGLRNSFPSLHKAHDDLPGIPGNPPNLLELPQGCNFQDRCPFASTQCRQLEPTLQALPGGHQVACHHPLALQDAQEVNHAG